MKKMIAVCSMLCAFAVAARAGNRPAGNTRTVSGAFTTVFMPDDGSSTTLSTPPPFRQTAAALLVPDDSETGYTEFPITLGKDNTFTVEGVPTGSYFLELDTTIYTPVPAISSSLIELTTDSPDLSIVNSGRPDLARVTRERR